MSPSPSTPAEVAERIPLFDSFPYLTTRLVPAAYHLTLLPAHWTEVRLLRALEQQVAANQFQTALVLGPRRAIYLAPGAQPAASDSVPRSTAVLTGLLLTPTAFDAAALGDRLLRLEAYRADMNGDGGTLFGDLTKGGRPATPEELERLDRGLREVPPGLERCAVCGEWCGECLDTVAGIADTLVVRVHCLCDNVTRCARCLHPLRERRLNGNEFCPEDGRVWHWPGFMAGSHHCGHTGGDR
jgi:hypothetical protein